MSRKSANNSTEKKVAFSNDNQPIPEDTGIVNSNPKVIKRGP